MFVIKKFASLCYVLRKFNTRISDALYILANALGIEDGLSMAGYQERAAECRKQGAEPRRRNQSPDGTGFKLTGLIIYRAVVSCSRLWLFLHVRVVCLLDFMDPGKLMPRPPA